MGTKEFKLMKASAFTQKVDEAKTELETFNQNAIAQAANDAAQAAIGAAEGELLEIRNDTKEYRDQSEVSKNESQSFAQAAQVSADVSAANSLVFPTVADSQELSVSGITIINAGTGGTDGTYTFSVLSASGKGAKGYYTVSGGVVSEAVITSRGYGYSGNEVVLTENVITDAHLELSFVDTVTNGDYFWVVSAGDSEVLELWLMGVSAATDTGKRTISTTATQEIIDYANEVYGKERLFYITDDQQSVRVAVGKDTLITETGNSIIVSLATA